MRVARAAADRFDAHDYPTTTDQLADAHGDVEFELPQGAVTLGEILAQFPNEPVEDADAARLLTYSAFGEAAIGRKGYSDRDATCPGEQGHERLSL